MDKRLEIVDNILITLRSQLESIMQQVQEHKLKINQLKTEKATTDMFEQAKKINKDLDRLSDDQIKIDKQINQTMTKRVQLLRERKVQNKFVRPSDDIQRDLILKQIHMIKNIIDHTNKLKNSTYRDHIIIQNQVEFFDNQIKLNSSNILS